jgi:ATP-dependent protease ClpP protease subunit
MPTEYRLCFAGDINLDRASNFRARIADILGRPDFGALTILYSGEGGSTDQSVALYNYIRSLPVAVHMHGIGHIGSAAIPVFLEGGGGQVRRSPASSSMSTTGALPDDRR